MQELLDGDLSGKAGSVAFLLVATGIELLYSCCFFLVSGDRREVQRTIQANSVILPRMFSIRRKRKTLTFYPLAMTRSLEKVGTLLIPTHPKSKSRFILQAERRDLRGLRVRRAPLSSTRCTVLSVVATTYGTVLYPGGPPKRQIFNLPHSSTHALRRWCQSAVTLYCLYWACGRAGSGTCRCQGCGLLSSRRR